MQLVFICSPFSGDIKRNTKKAAGYCRFAYSKGFVPYAPHLHNPNFLFEDIPEEREAGIALGIEILKRCNQLWLFGDKLTGGMRLELEAAQQMKIQVRYFTDKCEEREVN